MNRSVSSLLLFLSIFRLQAQQIDPEKLMTKRLLTCPDLFYNVTYLIPEYYNKGSSDTLKSILDYWQTNCGITEPLVRCRILLSIANNDFSEDIYDNYIIKYLSIHKQSKNLSYSPSFYVDHNFSQRLDTFTARLAQSLFLRDNLTVVERFFVDYYTDELDQSVSVLKLDKFSGTKLQEFYLNQVKMESSRPLWHGSLFIGLWIPQDSLKIIGVHPSIGFSGGLKFKKLYIDATFSFKVGKSPNVYKVEKFDSIWNTTHFFGGYLGLDLGYTVLSFKKNCFDLLGGIAYDGFDALSVKNKYSDNNISKSINALNLNIGTGYKRFINPDHYIGLDLKYNFVNYNNKNGTDLTGNSITINLIYGFQMISPYSRYRMRNVY